jgi:cysteine synthase
MAFQMVSVDLTGSRGTRLHFVLGGYGPTGSIKDGLAAYLLDEATRSGELAAQQPVVEVTTGNMGLALAALGAQRGHPVELILPMASTGMEARLRALGATPLPLSDSDVMTAALKLLQGKTAAGFYWPNQYSNPRVPHAYRAMGEQIVSTLGDAPGALFAAIGSGGTLLGLGDVVRRKGTSTIVAVETEEQEHIEGMRNTRRQNLGDADLYDGGFPDLTMYATAASAREGLVRLAEMGIVAGLSTGACVSAALSWLANEGSSARSIVVVSADGVRAADQTPANRWRFEDPSKVAQ